MAGGQVDAGHRRIVAADPAAEGDLADHQEQGQPRQSAGRRRVAPRREASGEAQGEEKEQRQGGEAAEQMGGDHLRPELEGHRPHAEGGLRDHHREQQQRQLQRLAVAPAADQRMQRQAKDEQAEGAGEIAVDHLIPALLCLHRGVGEVQFGVGQLRLAQRHVDETVAAWPVRTAEAGVGQPGISAEQDHHGGQQGRQHGDGETGFAGCACHSRAPFSCRSVLIGPGTAPATPINRYARA